MRSLNHSYLDRAGEETRLVVETLLQVVPGTQIVAVVTNLTKPLPGFELEPLVGTAAERAFDSIRERVRLQLTGRSEEHTSFPRPHFAELETIHPAPLPGFEREPLVGTDAERAFDSISERVRLQLTGEIPFGSFSCVVLGVEWGVLVDSIVVQDGDVVGALVVARHGRTWSGRERSLTKAFSSLLSHVATLATREGLLLHQRRLDELVAQVAEKLMPASATNRKEVLDWVCEVLAEFLNADVAFIRRHDHARGLTILESEWPPRDDIPDPDPLGEIPYDADPIFIAMWDLRAPYLTGTEDLTDDYRDRTLEADPESEERGE